MTFELAAARILAPSIGSSTYVWTSVIGVIIAALAFGFYVGGKLADARDRSTDLIWLLLAAAYAVIWTLLFYPAMLVWITEGFSDVRLQGVVAAALLFAPTSFLIGVTSPYLAKLNVRSLKTTGQHIASLDALNSVGGITGTFLTGFVLFGFVGSRQTFVVVVVLLLAASWLVDPKHALRKRIGLSLLALIAAVLSLQPSSSTVDIDTATAHYQVASLSYSGDQITGLTTGPGGIQSAVYESNDALVFWYTNEMARIAQEGKPKRILILGGGAFTLPQYLSNALPESQIDVVEIDPGLEKISTDYFDFKHPPNVNLIFGDARSYLNTSNKTYDIILVDVYGDSMIPFTLMTKEYVKALEKRLAPDGRVVVNVIAGAVGECRNLFGSIDAAYASQFSRGYYATESGYHQIRANYILAYDRGTLPAPSNMKPVDLSGYRVFTDNYTPAERLYYGCRGYSS